MWCYLWTGAPALQSDDRATYNFLITGHTKFAPDWCFGLVKQRTRKTFISSLFDIARAVDRGFRDSEHGEFLGLHNGTVLIPTYDWMSYLDTFFKKIPHLKTYRHFRFDKAFPGTVFCKHYFSSEETAINIFKTDRNMQQADLFPPVITPKGISHERAKYLYKEIREFCRPGTEDFVAPEVH